VVVVASDGVWDVLSVEAALGIVVYTIGMTKNPATAAGELVAAAKRAGSADDVSAAVVWLKRKDVVIETIRTITSARVDSPYSSSGSLTGGATSASGSGVYMMPSAISPVSMTSTVAAAAAALVDMTLSVAVKGSRRM